MHGYYDVSWAVPHISRRRSQLDAILRTAQDNLDTVYLPYLWLQPDERGYKPALNDLQFANLALNTAHKRGVSVIFEDVRSLSNEERRELATHPALAAFGVLDDANTKPHAQRLAACEPEVAQGARRYISIGAAQDRPETACYGLTEQIGVQIYPYQFKTADPDCPPDETLEGVWPILLAARHNADQHGQRLIANLQIHRNYSARHPTPEQVRALAWTAWAAGIDGALWYARLDNDPAGPLLAPPALLDTVRAATAAIRAGVVGRAAAVREGHILNASWAGGTQVKIDLRANKVLKVTANLTRAQ